MTSKMPTHEFTVIDTIDNLPVYKASDVRNILEHELGWQITRSSPDITSIDPEVTKSCDFKCPHCWVDLPGGMMNLETFEKIMTLAKESHIETLQFTGGEPTLNKDLLKMAERAKQEGFHIILRSHGRNMNKAAPDRDGTWAQAVAKIFDEVVISIDGTARSNFAMRPAKTLLRTLSDNDREAAEQAAAASQFDDTMAGYRALSEASHERADFKLKINTVVAKANLADLPNFAKYLESEVNAGHIRVDNWDMTQVVPSDNAPGNRDSFTITDNEFWSGVLRAAQVSPSLTKRAKPKTDPRCFIIDKDGAAYVNGAERIHMGLLSEQTPNAVAAKFSEYAGTVKLGEQRNTIMSYQPGR